MAAAQSSLRLLGLIVVLVLLFSAAPSSATAAFDYTDEDVIEMNWSHANPSNKRLAQRKAFFQPALHASVKINQDSARKSKKRNKRKSRRRELELEVKNNPRASAQVEYNPIGIGHSLQQRSNIGKRLLPFFPFLLKRVPPCTRVEERKPPH